MILESTCSAQSMYTNELLLIAGLSRPGRGNNRIDKTMVKKVIRVLTRTAMTRPLEGYTIMHEHGSVKGK